MTSSVIYYSTDARKNEIYLLNRPQICLQIDQMSIKIESSRNITNVSAIDPKVRLQMATSVSVYIMYSCMFCPINFSYKINLISVDPLRLHVN